MDAKIFGAFLADCRREKNMTQAELAQRLHVTDKAVSRWERGIGFPDINTIEPLAEALGISVLELMKSERITADEVTREEAAEIVSDTLRVAQLRHTRGEWPVGALLGRIVLVIFGLFLLSIPLFYLDGVLAINGVVTVLYGLLRVARVLAAASAGWVLRERYFKMLDENEPSRRWVMIAAFFGVWAGQQSHQSNTWLSIYYTISDWVGFEPYQRAPSLFLYILWQQLFYGDLFWCILLCVVIVFARIPKIGKSAKPGHTDEPGAPGK